MSESEPRRIHFLTDVRDLGAAYECRRCGHATATKVEMYEHRKGLLSRCFRARLKEKAPSFIAESNRNLGDNSGDGG